MTQQPTSQDVPRFNENPQHHVVLLGDLVAETGDASGTFDPSVLFDTPLNRQRYELRRKHRLEVRRQKRNRHSDGLTIVEAVEAEQKLMDRQQKQVQNLMSKSLAARTRASSAAVAGGKGSVVSSLKKAHSDSGVAPINTTVGLVPVSTHGFMQSLPLEHTGHTRQNIDRSAQQRQRSISVTDSFAEQPQAAKKMLGAAAMIAGCESEVTTATGDINVAMLPRDRSNSAPKLLVMNPHGQCHHLVQTDVVNYLECFWSPPTIFQQEYARCFTDGNDNILTAHAKTPKAHQIRGREETPDEQDEEREEELSAKKVAAKKKKKIITENENKEDDDNNEEEEEDDKLVEELEAQMKSYQRGENDSSGDDDESDVVTDDGSPKNEGGKKRNHQAKNFKRTDGRNLTNQPKKGASVVTTKRGAYSTMWHALTPNQRKYYQLKLEQKVQSQRGAFS